MPKNKPKAREAEDVDLRRDKPVKESSLRSRETGDAPIFTDSMFNFVAGSSFEIGTALAILDAPGDAGRFMDGHAEKIAAMIDRIYDDPEVGGTMISLSPTSAPISLKTYFDNKILKELNPNSDQIGRCLDKSKAANWLNGEGKTWLVEQLRKSSASPDYNYTNMLTKIRTVSACGTIFREMMPNCQAAAAALLGKSTEVVEARNTQIATQIRHAKFDDKDTRARAEKMPIIEGKPLSAYSDVAARTTDAGPVGLGFGAVWHPNTMDLPPLADGDSAEEAEVRRQEVITKYRALEADKGRQGMPRVGQDMKDPLAPGLLGESSQPLIPKAFQEVLAEQLATHQFDHGSGLNRWRLTGSYAKESWNASMPAAGAHSGGTSDIFLALNCLGDESIFGKEEAKSAGLLVSSFMNFGGYHSFVETFPIAQAVAADSKFEITVTSAQRGIYGDIAATVDAKCGEAAHATVEGHLAAYQHTMAEIAAYQETMRPPEEVAVDAVDLEADPLVDAQLAATLMAVHGGEPQAEEVFAAVQVVGIAVIHGVVVEESEDKEPPILGVGQ